MGIKNLLKFLSEYPDIVQEKKPTDFYGKKIAIDISILMYQVVIAIRNSGSDLTNASGEITSHILGLFNKTISFLEKGIIPIYVFDGKPPILKYKILDARKQVRKRALEKLSDAQNDQDKIKYLKRSVLITKDQMNQCRELLTLMGIPYIDAPEEADSELSYLCKENLVYAVLTEDMDILTFGSPKIIRNLTTGNKAPLEIDLDQILKKLNLTYEQFIELCILFGCDYCLNLSEIRFNIMFETYIKYKNIEATLNDLKTQGYTIPDNYEYSDAKQYFTKSSFEPVTKTQINIKKPNNDQILKLLVGKYGLIKYKVINKLTKLNEYYEKFKEY
jgi:flap endonuclease-1